MNEKNTYQSVRGWLCGQLETPCGSAQALCRISESECSGNPHLAWGTSGAESLSALGVRLDGASTSLCNVPAQGRQRQVQASWLETAWGRTGLVCARPCAHAEHPATGTRTGKKMRIAAGHFGGRVLSPNVSLRAIAGKNMSEYE